MIYSIDGNIVTLGGAFLERKINTLTFQYEGSKFPLKSRETTSYGTFAFVSSKPNSVTVNYGDGVVETIDFEPATGGFGVYWMDSLSPSHASPSFGKFNPYHQFQDSNIGLRNMTFQFEDIRAITKIHSIHCLGYGMLPKDINYAENIEEISIEESRYYVGFPEEIAKNKNITKLNLSRMYQGWDSKIPDAFFNLSLKLLAINNIFNLSDIVSSNLYKLNQLVDLE